MIKIRSTEKLATSNTQGNCDITRQMLSYKEDLTIGKVTIVIEDNLIQEKEVTKTVKEIVDDVETDVEVTVNERVVIEKRQPRAFIYPSAFIDAIFSQIGTTISKTKSYSEQSNANKITILIAQTVSASDDGSGWHNMTNWIPDKEHELVDKFTE
jgi:hypothetical protein